MISRRRHYDANTPATSRAYVVTYSRLGKKIWGRIASGMRRKNAIDTEFYIANLTDTPRIPPGMTTPRHTWATDAFDNSPNKQRSWQLADLTLFIAANSHKKTQQSDTYKLPAHRQSGQLAPFKAMRGVRVFIATKQPAGTTRLALLTRVITAISLACVRALHAGKQYTFCLQAVESAIIPTSNLPNAK